MPKPPRLHILIADDDRSFRQLISDMIQSAQYHVIAAVHSGEELVACARERLQNDEPLNCIVVDWQLLKDGIDGLTTIQRVNEMRPTKAILITGNEMGEDQAQRVLKRDIKYVQKGTSRMTFLSVLATIQNELATEAELLFQPYVIEAKQLLLRCGITPSEKEAENLIGEYASKNTTPDKRRNLTSHEQALAIFQCRHILERLQTSTEKAGEETTS